MWWQQGTKEMFKPEKYIQLNYENLSLILSAHATELSGCGQVERGEFLGLALRLAK